MDAPAAPMIEFKDVVQSFGRKTPIADERRVVLDHVDLTVPHGSILCLLGPSGCGKTTMVNLVMDVTVPVSGEVRVMGKLAPYLTARPRIGFMPQDEALSDVVTAEENLHFFGTMNGLGGDALRQRIDEMLAFARLEDDRRKLVGAFSGGMKRRLSLAVAMLHEPDLLVLDEPTVGLDPDHRRRIWERFDRLAAGGTLHGNPHPPARRTHLRSKSTPQLTRRVFRAKMRSRNESRHLFARLTVLQFSATGCHREGCHSTAQTPLAAR